MARTVTYRILDEADGRFAVVAELEPGRTYRRDALATRDEAQAWVEGLRVLMAALGAPVVSGDPAVSCVPAPSTAPDPHRSPRGCGPAHASSGDTARKRRAVWRAR